MTLHVETDLVEWLMQRLAEGSLDLALTYAPQGRFSTEIEEPVDEILVLPSTEAGNAEVDSKDYLFVDWGENFKARRGITFPQFGIHAIEFNHENPALTICSNAAALGIFRPVSFSRTSVTVDSTTFLDEPNSSAPPMSCFSHDTITTDVSATKIRSPRLDAHVNSLAPTVCKL